MDKRQEEILKRNPAPDAQPGKGLSITALLKEEELEERLDAQAEEGCGHISSAKAPRLCRLGAPAGECDLTLRTWDSSVPIPAHTFAVPIHFPATFPIQMPGLTTFSHLSSLSS